MLNPNRQISPPGTAIHCPTMTVRVMIVTPAMARAWLEKNDSNRRMRDNRAELYADQMAAGTWTQCIDAIGFYTDGSLANGQHRLTAVVQSDVAQTFIIVEDLARRDGLNMDIGATRNLVDAVKISGEADPLSNALLACTLAIERGARSGNPLSNAEKLSISEKHREAGTWALAQIGSRKYLCGAFLTAAVARAWYHEEDKVLLARFCEVVRGGIPRDDSERVAVALRDHLLRNGSEAGGPNEWRNSFLKVQRAIHNFMRKRPVSTIKLSTEECYPLLEEATA